MATSTASLAADTKSDILSETADTSTSPQRPTSLFTKFNTEGTGPSLDTLKQSPINASAIISGGLTATLSPNSSTSSITSPFASASATNFPPEMPQWKKDLIQRRKSNVARTINTTGGGGGAVVASATSPVQPHSPSSLASTSTSTSSTSLMGDHAADVLQMPTTPTKGAKQIASQYDTLTASVNPLSATGKTAEQKNAKTNFYKMPATLNSPIKSPTTPTHHDSGGHYTPQVELKLDTNTIDGMSIEPQELPTPKQRSTLYSSKISNNNNGSNNAGKSSNHHQYQSNKRNETSTIISTTTITTITTENERAETSVSTTPSTPLTTRLAGFGAAGTIATTAPSSLLRAAEVFETQETETETETARKPSSSSKCGTYTSRQSHSICESERTLSSVSSESQSPSPSLSIGKIYSNNSNSSSYHAASGSHKSVAGISDGTAASATVTTVCDSEKTATPPVVCGKISSKLQNNQFIKNQVIYQQQKSLEILVTTSPGGSVGTLTSPTSVAQPSSPNKFANNNKKKMVAVHEIKKTTAQQHSTHQLHHHHNQHHHRHHQQGTTAITAAAVCGRQRLQQRNSSGNNEDAAPAGNIADFDPSEDLSYGPGIVSKLRCRYLSLALRESMEKERHCLDNLRRATSLNNLLDRNDDEEDDDEDDDDGEEEENSAIHDDEVDVASDASGGKLDKSSMVVGGGILKRTTQSQTQAEQNNQSVLAKKTAIYQKHSQNSTTLNANGHGSINQRSVGQNGSERNSSGYGSQSKKVATESSNGAVPTLRHGSRHLKRGNDSLKRARSVEALLCEKTPWNFAMNRSSLQTTTNGGNNNGGSIVTIEDKIHNARERLILGSDAMPPRRLTSIIDDTERPPPDLVKQTLKLFEATANRRGRGGQRSALGGGEVASKVANYKSIIKENKPAVVFPKPPASPNKKLNSVGVKHTVKPTMVSADLLSSPIGRKTAAAAAAAATSGNLTPNVLETDKQLSSVTATTTTTPTVSTKSLAPKLRERAVLSETGTHSDNTSQRNKLLSDPKSELFGSCVESPVSALTKKLEKLCIENEKQSPMKHGIMPKESSHAKAINADVVVGGVSSEGAAEPLGSKKQLVGGSVGVDVGETATSTTSHEPSNRDKNTEIENLRRINRRGRNTSTEELDLTTKGEKDDDNDEDFVVAPDVSTHGSDRDSNAKALGIGTFGSGESISSSSDQSDDNESGCVSVTTKRVTKSALENIAKAGTTQQFKFSGDNSKEASVSSASSKNNNKQILNGGSGTDNSSVTVSNSPHESTKSMLNLRATTTGGKQIGVIRPLLTTPPSNQHQQQHHFQQHQHQQHVEAFKAHQSIPATQLTSREIEKNRINEMKKTAANASSITAMSGGIGIGTGSGSGTTTTAGSVGPTTSLDTVINTNSNNSLNKLQASAAASSGASSAPSSIAGNASGLSELDATNSPLWALRKKRQTPPAAAAENTTMVFNFRDREKVPDYIENDGVIFRRKRVLPKPNESGFVRLPDLSLETSTDSDYDDFSMCPPSPCDVQFENANIVIDGKSSIRQKSKEATFRVQFNDTLTSTFEYPSEASLILEESFEEDHYVNTNDIVSAYENLVLDHIDSATSSPAHHHHHHVAVDEIIPLPTTNANATPMPTPISTNATTPTKNILGNLPLGSAPLGSYTPIKAPIENIFQLGVTRAPLSNSHATQANPEINSNGIKDDLKCSENGDGPDSLQYIKPANEDLTIAYSEGTQKTDLLY